MLMIRLSRVGKKKRPMYRVVVQEKHKATSSDVLEIVGHYNPHTDPATLEVKEERVRYWRDHGAQLSGTLNNLLITKGTITGEKVRVAKPKKVAVAPEVEQASASAAPAEKKEEPPAQAPEPAA